jgi:hypothetical protein
MDHARPSPTEVRVDDPTDVDLDQIVERLGWTPWERLQYLLDMLEFEELAHRARRVDANR